MDDILYRLEGGIANITINRPKVLNALSAETLLQLTEALLRAERERDALCVILDASGEKAFCVGGDIKEEVQMDGYSAYDFGLLGQNVMRCIRSLRMPVIAAIHGYALGAGMELLLAADFAFVSDDVRLSIPSINLGSMPGFCGTQLLPRAVGAMRAKEILMTGRHLYATEVVALGLALEALPRAELLHATRRFANELCSKAPFALRCIKTAVNKSQETDLDTGFLLEAQLFSRVQASADKQQGMEAFLEKRPPAPYLNR